MTGKAGYNVDNPSINSFRRSKFKPQKGFGGNPLDTGNWWKLTSSMFVNIQKFGLLSDLMKFNLPSDIAELLTTDSWIKEDNIIISTKRFADSLKSQNAKMVYDNDKFIAKEFSKLSKETVFLIPENGNGKNSDSLYNNHFLEFKFAHRSRRAVQANAFAALNPVMLL